VERENNDRGRGKALYRRAVTAKKSVNGQRLTKGEDGGYQWKEGGAKSGEVLRLLQKRLVLVGRPFQKNPGKH